MLKLAHIYRFLLLAGLFLSITAVAEMSANNYISKKTEINAGNYTSLNVTSNENLVADLVDNEITEDVESNHQFLSINLRSGSYGFCDVASTEERSVLTKFSVPFYKFSHLFILFHCWKYLCL